MNADCKVQRDWIVTATKSITLNGRREPELRARLDDPGSDCTFEELHFDSLARMELCIWMQTEVGVELGEDEILAHPCVNAPGRPSGLENLCPGAAVNGLEAFRACRTPADFYRLQIELENDCAPAELLAMLEPRDELPVPARKWIERLEGMMRTGNAPIQPFERVRLADHVHFFRGAAPEGAPKSLLLCFCGNYHRLMVPLPVFLQHVPAREFDVVVFKDALRCFFLRGVQGYGENFGELRERLARDLPLDRYASLRCIGTSSGGAAGLVAGALFGADRALAFGGIHPSRSAENMSEEVDGCELDPFFARAGESPTRLLALYGAGNERDREAAATLCRSFGAAAMAVPGVVTHNIFYELFERGELTAFLSRNLLGSLAELDGAMAEATPVDRLTSPGPKGRRRRSPVTRMKGAWKRFGGWDQFAYWNSRCAGYLLGLIRPGGSGRNKP